MRRRTARQIAAVLLYFAEDAGLWMLGLFSTDVHVREWDAESYSEVLLYIHPAEIVLTSSVLLAQHMGWSVYCFCLSLFVLSLVLGQHFASFVLTNVHFDYYIVAPLLDLQYTI